MQEKTPRDFIILVLDKIGHIVEVISGSFSVLLFATMTVVTLLGVLFRYVMSSPFEWTEEIARFLMLCICFLSINMAFRKKEHIAITTVVEILPPKAKKILDYLIDILISFFLILLIKQGYLMATGTLMSASTINISMAWIYMFVPLGAFLTLVQLILSTTKKLLREFEAVANSSER